MAAAADPAVWFPAVRTGTGTDVFTERLVAGLHDRGLRVEITWLPLRAEYAPYTVRRPKAPPWANVAHVNTWLPPCFLPKSMPVVATIHHAVHDPAVRAYKDVLRAAYHRWWIAPNERRVLQRAARVVAVSEFVAAVARHTLVNVPMDVIRNGVDSGKFSPGGQRRRVDQPFRLVYVGSWKRLKGVDLLAPVMRALGDGFELHYTGGPAAARDRLALPPNMHDLGRLDATSVAAALRDADALLFPSRSEGLPLVVLEAMACGVPVIATRGSALVEVVADGETGILCTCDDVHAFAAAARLLAADPRMDADMRRAARARAVREFSLRQMADAYLQVYQQVADPGPRFSNPG